MSGAKAERFTFLLNGTERALEADGKTPLLDVLRNALGLKGTRFGCGNEECGACFVLVDGRAAASCNLPLWAVDSKAVTTIEGLGQPEAPHRLQQAFIAEQAAQCGYCTSGMLLSAFVFLQDNPRPSREAIVAHMARNLCRCGAHQRIVDAIEAVARAPAVSRAPP